MSHQVLARKYRPQNFQELVGQDHVRLALTHALEQKRLHHAYLFTGTRGVGKTTIARIFTKCLNCETGITATPCGTCNTCVEITAGRYVDLLEVDAASRTKVEDTRELLDNVQYLPTRGRYKVYLIDEVHMLSGHSFNALLKTLEEPPEHVIFLLATTDPQKLPVTVLSRCLQFYLRNLPQEQILQHLSSILQKENIAGDVPALKPIARAAQGSMRDALSLLDQAIGFCGGTLTAPLVREMVGNIAQEKIYPLLDALHAKDGRALLQAVTHLFEIGAQFDQVLEELLTTLHYLAIEQTSKGLITDLCADPENIAQYAEKFSKEDVQLFYQIALIGKRDLPLAPDHKMGFEMIMLRMLAFQPGGKVDPAVKPRDDVAKAHAGADLKAQAVADVKAHAGADLKAQADDGANVNLSDWHSIVAKLSLDGMAKSLLSHCSLHTLTENAVSLHLSPSHAAMKNDRLVKRVNDALTQLFAKPMMVNITVAEPTSLTPAQQALANQEQAQQQAFDTLAKDDTLQHLQEVFGVSLQKEHIINTKPTT